MFYFRITTKFQITYYYYVMLNAEIGMQILQKCTEVYLLVNYY